MTFDRRAFLKSCALGAGSCLLAGPAAQASALAESNEFGQKVSMLNDCTLCVGCRGCQNACKEYFGLNHTGPDDKYDMPQGLEASNYTTIKLSNSSDEHEFIKRQCMHCNYPSCASACPVGALHKQENGAITYDPQKCIGCRYCMVACPFNVPRFEYDSPTPQIRKCTFCYEKISQGEKPVCAQVCPTGAIMFGTRDEMLALARERIAKNPGRYIDHVYGETEVGGTSVMYLAGMPFANLGLRNFGDQPLPLLAENVQHGIFKYFVSPFLLLGLLGLIRMANMKCDPLTDEDCWEEDVHG